ncbi:MAG TPA: hypothetical protein VG755_32025 [Nannocystaceae bacterium]|nr:hypothetical protein [Nannocystaceae bacterium]
MRRVQWIVIALASGCGADGSSGSEDAGETGTSAPSDSSGNATTVMTSAPGEASSPGTSSADETGAPTGPTFAEDVAPILATHCWSCHVEGGFGPIAFVDYEDARALGPGIVAVTNARQMPPWPPDGTGACQELVDTRWLTDDELATLSAWVDAGSPPGDLTQVPSPPSPPVLEDVSATVQVPTYTPVPDPPEHPNDDYRCFVVDPGLPAGGTITAFEVHPGVIEQAHHIVLFSLDSDDAVAQALANDASDAAPGYQCFGGAGVGESRILGAWTPGVPVVRYPAGTGMQLSPGRPMVVQMHYNIAGGARPDDTSIDLQLDDGVTPLQTVIVVDSDLAIPPDVTDHVEESFTTLEGSADADLVAVFPHMHQIGRTLQVEINGSTCAVDVPRYDFHWQELYSYVNPIRVHPGDEVHLRCTYDSLGRDTTTTWGEGSGDEMCAAVFFARPVQ